MSVFGWSLPPGCSGTPYDESGACDLGPYLTSPLPENVLGVFWDEDGNLIESTVVTVPADEFQSGYTETDTFTVGKFDWSDDLSENQNFAAAAAAYLQIVEARK